jgi:hypothetical protein
MATVGFQQSQKSSINFSLSLSQDGDDLSQRIDEFKQSNPEDVEELKKCIADVLGEAEKTAQERLDQKAVSWHLRLNLPIFLLMEIFFTFLFDNNNNKNHPKPKSFQFHVNFNQLHLNEFPESFYYFSFAERWSERKEFERFHVGPEGQK